MVVSLKLEKLIANETIREAKTKQWKMKIINPE